MNSMLEINENMCWGEIGNASVVVFINLSFIDRKLRNVIRWGIIGCGAVCEYKSGMICCA